MQKINSESRLREAILQLERRRADEEILLKEEFLITMEGLRPINLIKSTFREVATSREVKTNLLTTVAGLSTGYLAKVLVASMTKSPFKRILGTIAMVGITNLIARNPEVVKSLGRSFFKMIRSKSNGKDHSI